MDTRQIVLDALKNVRYPGTGKNIVESEMVKPEDVIVDGKTVDIRIHFDRPTDPFIKSIIKAAETAVITFGDPTLEVKGNVTPHYRQQLPQPTDKPLKNVRNIIGVSSGKGGVGKSTVAANLAVALAAEGYKVGLLDADIFGPSVPKMFGIENYQLYMHKVDGRDLIIPAERYGVKILSIGFLVDKNSAVMWRGAMASNALKQLINDVDWGELDYFLIDMPPGTSDIHLTLVQTLPITGVVVVSTPQEVALADARKGIAMFRDPKVDVPVLGIVENMAWFTPERHPDERYYIFGREGAANLAKELDVPLLAQIPVTESICDSGDSGRPVALEDNITAQAFVHLAREVVDAVDNRNSTLPPTKAVLTK